MNIRQRLIQTKDSDNVKVLLFLNYGWFIVPFKIINNIHILKD